MHTRTLATYDPRADLAARYPGWGFLVTELPAGMDLWIDPGTRTIWIDAAAHFEDMDLAESVAVAHLDLHLPLSSGRFTDAQETDALGLAEIRLDRLLAA